MDKLTKPAITRLARRSGVKSLSEDSYQTVRTNIDELLEKIIHQLMIVHNQNKTKMIMSNEIYKALETLGYNVAQSDDLNTSSK